MSNPYERPARPWDLFNKNLGRVELEVSAKRMETCQSCPKFLPTGTCSECGCIMSLKTKLPNAYCPLHKWDQVQVSYKEEIE